MEFEEVDPGKWDIENDCCNIQVDLEEGTHYGFNVWTYKFLETILAQDKTSGKNLSGLYTIPPDLFVKESVLKRRFKTCLTMEQIWERFRRSNVNRNLAAMHKIS